MIAHIAAIRALLVPLGWATYYVDVPDTPALPYVLLWSSAGLPGVEQSVDGARTDIDTTVGLTAVAGTPDGVLIVQKATRGILAPGGLPKSLTVTGRVAVLSLFDSRPIAVDPAVTVPTTNRPVSYGVDVYRLMSVPA
jgi:hypothetical protein